MTYLKDGDFLTIGAEIEIANQRGGPSAGWNAIRWQSALFGAGFDWVSVKSDATPGVDAEIIIPPFPAGQDSGGARVDIMELFAKVESLGGRVGLKCTGGHVHIGNAKIENMRRSQYWLESKRAMRRREYYTPSQPADPMPLELVRDIINRYAKGQEQINAILARSRRNNRYCLPLGRFGDDRGIQGDSIGALATALGGKFSAINLLTWSRVGTIEFRQHQSTLDDKKLIAWSAFLDNLIRYSDSERLEESAGGSAINQTPEQIFRRGSRVAVIYTMARQEGGATTRQLMDATGWDAQTIRSRFSEIRAQLGQQAVITHNQQSYGHTYGSSRDQHDLNGYEIARELQIETGPAYQLKPENRRGMDSVWAGLPDDLFEYFNSRRGQLR